MALAMGAVLVGCATRDPEVVKMVAARESMEEVWSYVNSNYVDGTFNGQDWNQVRKQYFNRPAETREKIYEQIREMLKTLDDPFTRFLDPEQFRSLQTTTSGELEGIGVQITKDPKSDLPVVIAAVEGTPAFRGGIKAKDLIVAIDGEPTKALQLDQIADRLRGRIGTQVRLTVQRDGRTFEVALQRETIQINPVTSEIKRENGRAVGYVRLAQFNANAVTQVRQAVLDLDRQGAGSFILDLRSNPGGLLTGGIEIARLFLRPGQVVVYTVDRLGRREETTAVSAPLTGKPMVLLVDAGTASASEILAGALKDNRRAVLVGTRTFGKGLIQAVRTLKDGSGIALSIARYQTPNRVDIHKKGIQPDIFVELPESIEREQIATPSDPQYAAAVKALDRAAALVGG
jgi:carboxyl-terminal processing protease